MPSREIAALTNKRHADVMRDIRKTLEALEINESKFASVEIDMLKFQRIYKDTMNHPNMEGSEYEHRGNTYTEYHLNKELTLTLVSGYNVKLRNAIIKRWQELEDKDLKSDIPAVVTDLQVQIAEMAMRS